jgi:hypothetical protein
MLISLKGTGKHQLRPGQEGKGGCSIVVILSFAKKFLTRTDQCVHSEVMKEEPMLVLHFLGGFLQTAFLRI